MLVGTLFGKLFRKKDKMDDIKPYLDDMDFPCGELSIGGLGFAVALLVRPGINFSCVSSWGPIQLYGIF